MKESKEKNAILHALQIALNEIVKSEGKIRPFFLNIQQEYTQIEEHSCTLIDMDYKFGMVSNISFRVDNISEKAVIKSISKFKKQLKKQSMKLIKKSLPEEVIKKVNENDSHEVVVDIVGSEYNEKHHRIDFDLKISELYNKEVLIKKIEDF